MALEHQADEPKALAEARANELLYIAKHLFGPMTSPWRYAGVVFRDQPPHLYYALEDKSVQIALSLRAIDDEFQRDFQLSHEICHLLYPSVEPDSLTPSRTTALNEGISTYFSILTVTMDYGEEAANTALQSPAEYSLKYFKAFQFTSSLLQANKDSVKNLRAI